MLSGCIEHLRTNSLSTIEPTQEGEDRWMAGLQVLAENSLYPKANTWYTGSNIVGKPRGIPFYLGGLGRYRELCNDAIDHFRFFDFTREKMTENV